MNFEERIERLKKKEELALSARSSMPRRSTIAAYWCEQAEFPIEKLDWTSPACFACGYAKEPTEDGNEAYDWNRSRLQRCHLIAVASGGRAECQNLVLLCLRCHREAPMVGASRLPMLLWLNRREDYFDYVQRRTLEECAPISDSLAAEISAIDSEQVVPLFKLAMDVLDLGYHPGGDILATVVQGMAGAVKINRRVPRIYGLEAKSR